MTRNRYRVIQLLVLAFTTSVLVNEVVKDLTALKSSSIQCSKSPNGKLYLAPGC